MSTRIWPGDYFDAAGERLGDAHNLYKGERFGFALYAAGLSIECVLRAFRTRMSNQFDEKHDLVQLFDGCDKQFFGGDRREIDAAINAAWKGWRNDYRFHRVI